MFKWDIVGRDSQGKVSLLYRHERMFEEGLFDSPKRVLDVGGWGILALRLNEEGHQCTILDNFSEDQYFPERVRSLPYREGDITKLETFSDLGPFDVITCFEMLEHCNDQPQATRNMYESLVPGGFLVGTFPLPGFAHQKDEPDISFLTEDELYLLLKSSGFTKIMVEPTGSCLKEETPCSLYFKAGK